MMERFLSVNSPRLTCAAEHYRDTGGPHLVYLFLCLLLVMMPIITIGCGSSSSSSPAPERLADGVWVGLQEGRNGPWTTLALSMEAAYDAMAMVDVASGPYGIAVATADGAGKEVAIITLQADAAELSPSELLELVESMMEDDDTAKILNVNITPPLETDDPYAKIALYAQTLKNERTNIHEGSDYWDLTADFGLDDRPFDLVATLYDTEADNAPSQMIVIDDLDFEYNDSLSETIDFSGSDPEVILLNATGEINWSENMMDSAYVWLLTPNGTQAELSVYDDNPPGDSFAFSGITESLSVDYPGFIYLAGLYGSIEASDQQFMHYYWFDTCEDYDFTSNFNSFNGQCILVEDRGKLLPTLDDTQYENAIAYALAFQGQSSGSGITYRVVSLVTNGWLSEQATAFSMPSNLRDNLDWQNLWSIPTDTRETGSSAMVIAGNVDFDDIKTALNDQGYWQAPRFEDGHRVTILINGLGSFLGSDQLLGY